MELSSSAFPNNGTIPTKFTCDGNNISPELNWKDVPKKTQSLVLIFDDPDAPRGTWTHWVLYNIPANINSLEENANPTALGIEVGTNSWGKQQYGGPCPPSGEHRYIFKLYALDIKLDLKTAPTSEVLQQVIEGHILEQTTLLSRYQRK